MHRPSILLPITGSEESRYAAELCWNIAEKTDGKVLLQYVIDSGTVWELLRNDAGGLLGRPRYTNTYDTIIKELHSLGADLLGACVATAPVQLETDCIIDAGNPIEEICRRASEHDLVVVGHRLHHLLPGQNRGYAYLKYAIAEGLVYNCPRPLLIVQHKFAEPGTMKVVVTPDQANVGFIAACLRLAALLGMRPQLLCIATGSHSDEWQDTFKKALHELADAPVHIHMIGELVMGDSITFLDATGGQEIALDPSTNLLVIPTTGIGTARRTIIGVRPDLFLENSTPPNVLLWPEEHFPAPRPCQNVAALNSALNDSDEKSDADLEEELESDFKDSQTARPRSAGACRHE
jgi:nucleotide-binding universal stress UspA family protein